jgi:Domain of unknown function (DUF4157)
MILNLRKFCQFWLLMLATAMVTVMVLFPHSLQDRLSSTDFSLTRTQPRVLEKIVTHSPARAWGETGATVLPLAAQIMTMRNPQGVGLDSAQKGYLRPLFGDLVDRVTIVYQATLLDRWSQGGKETHIGKVNSSAQTYCDRIYIRGSYQPHNTRDLILIAHEMTHAQQCQQAGGIGKFGARYFQGYYQGGETYENNPLEKSARTIEQKFARQLCNKINCPPRKGSYYTNYKGWNIDLPANL